VADVATILRDFEDSDAQWNLDCEPMHVAIQLRRSQDAQTDFLVAKEVGTGLTKFISFHAIAAKQRE